nr:uncharacterized protein LOC117851653 isoform X3 [Setaria viridis]
MSSLEARASGASLQPSAPTHPPLHPAEALGWWCGGHVSTVMYRRGGDSQSSHDMATAPLDLGVRDPSRHGDSGGLSSRLQLLRSLPCQINNAFCPCSLKQIYIARNSAPLQIQEDRPSAQDIHCSIQRMTLEICCIGIEVVMDFGTIAYPQHLTAAT